MSTETANSRAVAASRWAMLAQMSLLEACKQLSEVGAHVADGINRGETDFLLAGSAIDDAWKTLTDRALINLGRARDGMVQARDLARVQPEEQAQ